MHKSQRAKRMERRHDRGKKAGALNLVSLMDIFTILVFFLLVNSSDVEVLPNAKDIQLPESIAEEKAKETVVILIGDDDILVQGKPVVSVPDAMSRKDDIAGREVTIMGDRDISYRLLKKVMATCTESEYGQISLAVLQKSSEKLDTLSAAR